jgi:DNA repair exonuclease SbcCD ATPase subunit
LGIQPWIVAVAAVVGCALGGLAVGLSRRCLDQTGCALLVDRGLGTREQIVSALEAAQKSAIAGDVAATGSALAYALIDRGRELAEELDPAAAVPLIRRRLLWPSLGLIPALVEEGQDLAERIQEITEQSDVELPEELRDQLDELAEQLKNEELTPEEAREKLEEMQDQLAEFQEQLADKSTADELQQAAEALADNPITEDLAKALEQPDLEQAAKEAEKLAQKAAEASAAEQQAAAGAMQQAAQALAQTNPELAQQLQQAAEALSQAAQNQGEGQDGQDGQGLTPEQAQQLAEQLKKMQADGMAEKLADDEELMKMSQRLNGALESSS